MKTGRVHLRIDALLLERVKKYASINSTSITRIIEEHLQYILRVEETQKILEENKRQ